MDSSWCESSFNKAKARIQRFEELKGQEGPAAKQSVDIALSGSRLGKKYLS